MHLDFDKSIGLIMSRHQPNTTPVRVVFQPYDHSKVNKLLRDIQDEFGWHGQNWFFKYTEGNSEFLDSWIVDICFVDPKDATLFALKYVGRDD